MSFNKKHINLQRINLFIRSLFLYLSAACITIIFLALALSYLFAQKNREDINNLTNITLSGIDNRITTLFETSKNQAFQLYYNNNSKIIRTSSQKEVLREVAYANDMQYIMTTSPYIKSIYLFNENTCLLKKYNDDYDFDIDNNELLKIVNEADSFSVFPRKATRKNGETVNVFTIIYLETPFGEDKQSSGAIMINLGYDECYKYIFQDMNHDDNELIYMNSTGEIYFHPDKNYFMTNLTNENYLHAILEQKKNFGFISTNENGKDIIINYFTNNKDTYIIYKHSLDSITKQFAKTRNTILYAASISLLVFMLLSFLVTYRLYLPLSKLLTKIRSNIKSVSDTKESSLSDLQLLSKAFSNLIAKVNDIEKNKNYALQNDCIKKLLNAHNSITASEAEELVSNSDINVNIYSPTLILVLRLDNYHEMESEGEDTLKLNLISIGNIGTEILSETDGVEYCQHFEVEISHSIIIINLTENNNKDKNKIMQKAEVVQNSVYKLLNISITIGISDVTEEFINWGSLYFNALDYTNYRLVYGKKKIFDSNIETYTNETLDFSKTISMMTEAVTSANELKFKRCFALLFTQFENLPYRKIIDTLVFAAQSIVEMGKSQENSSSENYLNIYNQLLEIEDISELSTLFLNLYEKTCSIIYGMHSKKTEDIVKQVIDFINTNYNDSQLSANLIADKINITPQYFSRVFKEITNNNFPEYINNIKLKKAKELIISTNLTIKEISDTVGYNNSTYFVTLFRKKYGIPPSKYRLNIQTHE